MTRVVVIGNAPGYLTRALMRAGAQYEVALVDPGITGRHPGIVFVDEFRERGAIIASGNWPGGSMDEFFAAKLEQCAPRFENPWVTPRRHGNPRPYLKRKKGRS